MKYRVKIEVSLKPGHRDPEGETAGRLLKELGYTINAVNVLKLQCQEKQRPKLKKCARGFWQTQSKTTTQSL
jgi:phosphoribosylformylglycinamidine (FGAM) synthase PurS component